MLSLSTVWYQALTVRSSRKPIGPDSHAGRELVSVELGKGDVDPQVAGSKPGKPMSSVRTTSALILNTPWSAGEYAEAAVEGLLLHAAVGHGVVLERIGGVAFVLVRPVRGLVVVDVLNRRRRSGSPCR